MDDIVGYIFSNYGHLKTLQESCANRNLMLEYKLHHSESPDGMRKALGKAISSDPEVTALLQDGPKAFRQSVTGRILRDHAHEVFLNYCPRCGALARTPQAKQCRVCFHSWHGTD